MDAGLGLFLCCLSAAPQSRDLRVGADFRRCRRKLNLVC